MRGREIYFHPDFVALMSFKRIYREEAKQRRFAKNK